MKTVGTFEAKIHFLTLLEQVERGEEITITRHGKAIARLVPVTAVDLHALPDTVARLKALREGRRLEGLTAKALIEEGRR
ncbi:MAG TPA: type II toxin-antitoxin system prevent-host-death family antitoxin [Rhodospirillales bacterium]|jgi:prevent-host-death family protein|nr:type II toxin-antitoxin system prevent-host-death family antitoxin [Rhodospirillales bacterium]